MDSSIPKNFIQFEAFVSQSYHEDIEVLSIVGNFRKIILKYYTFPQSLTRFCFQYIFLLD